MNDIWEKDSVLPMRLCDEIVSMAHDIGFKDANNPKRKNKEVFLRDENIRQSVLECVRDKFGHLFCNKTIEIGDMLETYLYTLGDQLADHFDGSTFLRSGNMAQHTLIAYLNEDYDGGETGFPDLKIAIRKHKGGAVLFSKRLKHNGGRVRRGNKLIVRIDVALVLKANAMP